MQGDVAKSTVGLHVADHTGEAAADDVVGHPADDGRADCCEFLRGVFAVAVAERDDLVAVGDGRRETGADCCTETAVRFV